MNAAGQKTPIRAAAVGPLLLNFLTWLVPGSVLLAFIVPVLALLVLAAPSVSDDGMKWPRWIPESLKSFLGVSFILLAAASLALLLWPGVASDSESKIFLAFLAVTLLVLGVHFTRSELRRLSNVP